MFDKLRYLLFQVRNADDPMRENEVNAFCRVLETSREQIQVFDLLADQPHDGLFRQADMFLFGGSGHYSAASDGDWLEGILELIREVHRLRKPTFASCWGFQAIARALGGRVIKDLEHAEVGTHELFLTAHGQTDPIFAPLGPTFFGLMGHEDRVVELPPHTTLLVSSQRVENQAYRFDDRPIYCTQFHPELTRADLIERVKTYPEYIARIARMSCEEFCEIVQDTPETASLLKRFVAHVFG